MTEPFLSQLFQRKANKSPHHLASQEAKESTSIPQKELVRGWDRVKLGKNVLTLEEPVAFHRAVQFKKNTRIGRFSYVNNGFIDHCSSIGRYCALGQDLRVGEPNHPIDWLSISNFQYNASQFGWHDDANAALTTDPKIRGAHFAGGPVVIGNDVWVGARVSILRGVTIGDGAIIAAGAVVRQDVVPYSIVGGVPAKHIRFRFSEEIRSRLIGSRWWDLTPNQLSGVPFHDVPSALTEIESRVRSGMVPEEVRISRLSIAGLSPSEKSE